MVTFETASDRTRQRLVADILADAWEVEFHDYPQHDRVDWFLQRDGRVVAVAEFKSRTTPFEKYPTVFLSRDKYNDILARASEIGYTGVLGLFIVQFTDKIMWLDIRNVRGPCVPGGRKPRPGSHKDIEMMYEVPIGSFQQGVPHYD